MLKKYPASLTKFEEFTKNFPQSKYGRDAWKYTITIKMILNLPYQAWKTYTGGISSYGREPEIEKNLGYMLLNETAQKISAGNFTEAKEVLNTMEEFFQQTDMINEINYYQALVLYQEDNFSEALKKFLNVLAYFKNKKAEPEILLKIGDCFFNMKNYVDSEKYYNIIISKFSDSPQAEWAKIYKALIYKRNMKYKDAKKYLLDITKNTKDKKILVQCFNELAKISELEDKKDEAIFWYNKILETTADNETILNTKLQLGYIYLNLKQYEKTIEIFSEYLNHKDDEDIRYALGLAYYNSDKKEEAIKIWELLLEQKVDYPLPVQALKAMYEFYKESNKREKMKTVFNKIWENYPDDNFVFTEGVFFINDVLNTEGIDVAHNYLKRIENQKNPDVLFLEAKILYLTGNIDESENILKNIDRKSIFAPEALYILIEINLAKSRTKEAQKYYVKLLASFPNSIWAKKAKENLSKKIR